jgi:hypothetical protein
MVVLPAEIPVTTPVLASIVAAAVEPLLHVPPATLLLSIIVDPAHTEDGPLIVPAFASAFTVNATDAVFDPQIFETV